MAEKKRNLKRNFYDMDDNDDAIKSSFSSSLEPRKKRRRIQEEKQCDDINDNDEYMNDLNNKQITIRLVHYSPIDLKDVLEKKRIKCFFEAFECKIKYSDRIFVNAAEIDSINEENDVVIAGNLCEPDGRRRAAAKDLIEAICDSETDVIWTMRGGDPTNTKIIEDILTTFIYEIHINSIDLFHIKNIKPKPMMGYSMMTPVLLYLSLRGLVQAIHGAMGFDIGHNLKNRDDLITLYKNIINENYCHHMINNIKHKNEAAINMKHSYSEINGIIIGGLLQIIVYDIKIALMIESKVGMSIITNRAIILFVELLDIGDELELIDNIFKMIKDNGITIKALVIGKVSNPEKIKKILTKYSNIANECNIPVVNGLNVGHNIQQQPILMSQAKLKYNDSGSLIISYSTDLTDKTIGLLNSTNVSAKSMWNLDQLKQKKHIKTPNISDELCTIL